MRAYLRHSDWILPAGLILLGLVPAIAGASRLAELAGTSEVTTENARFFAMPFPVVLHILAVIPYSLLGALQFSAGFRRRHRVWHRVAGRLLGACGLAAALSGLWMAHFYEWPAGDGVALYIIRLIVGVAMAASIAIGTDAVVRRRDFEAHGAWMIRAYALGMGAGTQVITHLPWFILIGPMPLPELPRAILMGGAWALNALVAERIIRQRRSADPTRPRRNIGIAAEVVA